MQIKRRKSKVIKIGNVYVGGNYPIAIQSMVKVEVRNIESTIRQIKELEASGCEIVRLAVKDNVDAAALTKIRPKVNIPLVADIHFDWHLALRAIDSGVDKIRLNPGNIYKKEQIRKIAQAARLNRIPIRVGVNSGSLRELKTQDPRLKTISEMMVKDTLDYIKILEKCGFYDIVVSLKGSNIFDTIEAYCKLSRLCAYPLHLGLTATGPSYMGRVKSSIAIGALLLEGIGDTIRVSLTDKPQEEVRIAKLILEALGLRCFGPEIISCPTCGRCDVDLVSMVTELENKLSAIRYPLSAKRTRVAVMGCVVNGPGEAKEADIGVAFGKKQGLLFRKGSPIKKISVDRCVNVLLEEINKFETKL